MAKPFRNVILSLSLFLTCSVAYASAVDTPLSDSLKGFAEITERKGKLMIERLDTQSAPKASLSTASIKKSSKG